MEDFVFTIHDLDKDTNFQEIVGGTAFVLQSDIANSPDLYIKLGQSVDSRGDNPAGYNAMNVTEGQLSWLSPVFMIVVLEIDEITSHVV